MSEILNLCCSLLFPKTEEKQNEELPMHQQEETLRPQPTTVPVIVEQPAAVKPIAAPAHAGGQTAPSHGQKPAHHTKPAASPTKPASEASAVQRQFKTPSEIPKELFAKKAILHGQGTMVIDGDTFKFYHQVSPESVVPKAVHVLKQETWPVRVAGIDSPETRHGDKPAMPFGEEAKTETARLVLRRPIKLQLLDLDQYERVVARIIVDKEVDLGVHLLQQGLAHLYTGKGAQYGGREADMKKAVEAAKAAKRGIWSQSQVQTPAEYKRLYKD
ncbi:putative endonuclease lcl3 [Kappamyces sp. JEL0680]|nr:putative endonuclease lcl3 [Kappamyces sp. JEL0680]